MNLITPNATQNPCPRRYALCVASLALLLSWQGCVAAPANSGGFKPQEAGPIAGFKPVAAVQPVPLNIEKIQTPVRATQAASRPALTGDAMKADLAQWVRYLGSPVKAVPSTALPRSESLKWVQYPVINNAGSSSPSGIRTDSQNWVRFPSAEKINAQIARIGD